MHEYSLVQALLRQVATLMQEQAASRVVSIRVSVGEFSGVESELFRGAYDMLVDATPVQGARLQLDRVPLESKCGECGHTFTMNRFRFQCPECGGGALTILRGEDLVLESVTLEQADNGSER